MRSIDELCPITENEKFATEQGTLENAVATISEKVTEAITNGIEATVRILETKTVEPEPQLQPEPQPEPQPE